MTLLALWGIGAGSPRDMHSWSTCTSARMLVASDGIDRWAPLILEAARRFAIPDSWIRAVIRAESAGRTERDGYSITSRAGAMGLMQVMPETYEQMRQSLGLGPDPYEPRNNILAGTAFLCAMYRRFGYPGLFAAYNAGPERFAIWLRQGGSLPRKTLDYLARVGPEVAETVLALGAPKTSGEAIPLGSSPSRDREIPSGTSIFFVIGQGLSTITEPFGTAPAATISRSKAAPIFVTRRTESALAPPHFGGSPSGLP